MTSLNASDAVIYIATRKHNSKRRSHCSFGRAQYFTQERGNLNQLDTKKTCGYLSRSVGLSRMKNKPDQPMMFKLTTKRRSKQRKPSKCKVSSEIAVGSKAFVKGQVDAQLKYRLYRGDLCRLAARRISRIQQIRSDYKRFLRREAKIAKSQEEEEEQDADKAKAGGDNLIEVD
mmetsp:Transcript_42419/g.68176  ORF Transcript_42419/g.68176 Transcript_42419/m.68176 type:complete len:174 (-) Transcript_42419:289-810(-)|eukprot:CAMPEP_0197046620 /NCGR_PEP_ID=MMETSP1384-20130603/22315_1 /TAXON_ID=29189 /ORGANISM="Ammonia sp." /LENGTH=173 /DNA_ID=CAMNT_0042478451 /DNA_START=137 /DNA_END=658 /DNA_ORIENTATION=-